MSTPAGECPVEGVRGTTKDWMLFEEKCGQEGSEHFKREFRNWLQGHAIGTKFGHCEVPFVEYEELARFCARYQQCKGSWQYWLMFCLTVVQFYVRTRQGAQSRRSLWRMTACASSCCFGWMIVRRSRCTAVVLEAVQLIAKGCCVSVNVAGR
jgi:hypothetical protein